MEAQKLSLLALGVLIFLQSCIPPSSVEIEKRDRPDFSKMKTFGIEIDGEVVYQFYHKYGFTDIEEYMLVILQPPTPLEFEWTLPVVTDGFERLNGMRFVQDTIIDLGVRRNAQADIRIEAAEFSMELDPEIFTHSGTYSLTQTDTTETLILFDRISGLAYIESKKSVGY